MNKVEVLNFVLTLGAMWLIIKGLICPEIAPNPLYNAITVPGKLTVFSKWLTFIPAKNGPFKPIHIANITTTRGPLQPIYPPTTRNAADPLKPVTYACWLRDLLSRKILRNICQLWS